MLTVSDSVTYITSIESCDAKKMDKLSFSLEKLCYYDICCQHRGQCLWRTNSVIWKNFRLNAKVVHFTGKKIVLLNGRSVAACLSVSESVN